MGYRRGSKFWIGISILICVCFGMLSFGLWKNMRQRLPDITEKVLFQ